VYTPGSHKTEHHDLKRFVPLGPKAQELLRPWLVKPPDAYLFDPKEAAAAFYAARKGEEYRIGQTVSGDDPAGIRRVLITQKRPTDEPSREPACGPACLDGSRTS
jgi:hypothetical protein